MKRVYGLIFCLGLLALIGTAGSCDMELISGAQATVQIISGMLMVLVGFIGGRLWNV